MDKDNIAAIRAQWSSGKINLNIYAFRLAGSADFMQ